MIDREKRLANKRRYYERHRDRILAEQKEFRRLHPEVNRAKARVQRERNPEADRARKERWAIKNRARRKEGSVRWRRANKQKVHAHNAVAWALKTKKIERPKCCEECSSGGRLVAHHDDYSKPLEVRWLCGKCHNRHHFLIAA